MREQDLESAYKVADRASHLKPLSPAQVSQVAALCDEIGRALAIDTSTVGPVSGDPGYLEGWESSMLANRSMLPRGGFKLLVDVRYIKYRRILRF